MPETTIRRRQNSDLRRRRQNYLEFLSARKRLPALMIYSTALFILSYLLVYLVNQLITMGCAELVGIQSSLRYFEIIYRLPFESPLWTHEKTVIISLTAPFVSLIAGSLLLFFVLKKVNVENIYKLFVFWIGFQSINFFFGGVIAGSVTGRGLGYALDMAFWPHIMIYITLIAICIFFLILLLLLLPMHL